MKGKLIPIFLSLSWLCCLWGSHAGAQEPVHTQLQEQVRAQLHEGLHSLVDKVDVTLRMKGGQDTICFLEFLEEWHILTEQHSISKEVLAHDSSCMALLLNLPVRNESIPVRNLSYEFNLLDPHLLASGKKAKPEPDSMDAPTRRLQSDLINLIQGLSRISDRYQLEDQLLSLIFYEDWSIDAGSHEITKKVLGISPVIWQRR